MKPSGTEIKVGFKLSPLMNILLAVAILLVVDYVVADAWFLKRLGYGIYETTCYPRCAPPSWEVPRP